MSLLFERLYDYFDCDAHSPEMNRQSPGTRNISGKTIGTLPAIEDLEVARQYRTRQYGATCVKGQRYWMYA